MVPRRYRLFVWAEPVILLGWLLIAFLDPDPRGRILEYVGLGFFFGTMFGQATLASAWNAFGPAPLVWRLPLSLLWVAMIPVAIAINVGLNGGPEEAAVGIGICVLGQWFAVQLLLWGLAIGYGLRLRHCDDAGLGTDPRERQFGIRQLMVITAIVGVAFGIGRLVVTNLGPRFDHEIGIFAFLAVAAIVITLPLLLAALLRRASVPATLLVLVLIGVATAWELPLLRRVHAGAGPQIGHLIGINAFTAAWILLVAVIVRLNGYCLATSGSLGAVEKG